MPEAQTRAQLEQLFGNGLIERDHFNRLMLELPKEEPELPETTMTESPKKSDTKYPRDRWNYASVCWETQHSKGGDWKINKAKSKKREVSKQEFIKLFLKVSDEPKGTYSDLSKKLRWKISRVKALRSRINRELIAAGLKHQLGTLEDYSPSQARTLAGQRNESFGEDLKSLNALFEK